MSGELRYQVGESDGAREMFVSGRLSVRDAEGFEALLRDIRDADTDRYVLDLSGLEHMDSAGLGKLILLRDAARAKGVELCLRRPQGRVKRILAVSQFEDEIPIQDD